ncbi:hypothetical protein N0V85_003655 [Neurospora sp. IMI 360204]|nr:hypothetical protein N0V85_003655 [Neurospora sp. IMI 360204]
MDTRTLEALHRLHVIKQLSLLVNGNAVFSVVDGPDAFKLQIWRKPPAEHEREEHIVCVKDMEACIEDMEEYYLQKTEESVEKMEE